MGPTEVQDIMRRHEAMKAEKAPWLGLWDELAMHCMPRRAGMTTEQASPDASRESRLYDITAVQANLTLAAGTLAWACPTSSPWFAFEPGMDDDGDDDAKLWLQDCTRRAARILAARSNFYSEIHESFLDRSTFGTHVIHCEWDDKLGLIFQCLPVNEVSLAENAAGQIDCVFREYSMTARALAEKFGVERLSEKVAKMATSGGAEALKRVRLLHAIYPRQERKAELGPLAMPVASCHVEIESKHVILESGYSEMPTIAGRYLHWNGGVMGGTVYGWAPSWVALPEARQLNFLQKMMDALAETKAFPRILAPSTFEGEFDVRAHGITSYAAGDAKPEAWLTEGDYRIGLDRTRERQEAIRQAFHVDLFQMFAQMERPAQMTAREVAERASEKLVQFSPTFSRLVSEVFNPLLRRIFSLLLRNGQFAPPPRTMIRGQTPDGLRGYLPEPEIAYTSRIALALKQVENMGFLRHLETLAAVSGMKPEILDNYDLDRIMRDTALTDGFDPRWLRKVGDIDMLREARAAAMAQQEQVAQAAAAADAAGKVGAIRKDSMLGEMIGAA